MTAADLPVVARHEDFELVYNLADPRPYYRGLQPLGYRAPTIVADYLVTHRAAIAEARGSAGEIAIVDFCCGYGANGALLNHDLSMAEVYDRYAADDSADSDAAFYRANRHESPQFDIYGIDIADNAVQYARRCGLIDDGSTVDLAANPVSRDLAAVLQRCDVVVESGGVGPILVPCYDRILEAVGEANGPWFLMCTRPDWDHDPLWAVFARHGYEVETVSDLLSYRHTMPGELDGAIERTRANGRDPARYVRDGTYHVPLTLARPAGSASE